MKHMIETMKLEKGKVTMCDMPFIFTFTKSIYYMQKELEKVLGEKWKKIFYERGREDGMFTNTNYLAMFRDEPRIKKLLLADKPDSQNKIDSLKFGLNEFNKLGLGKVELVSADSAKPRFIFRYYFSPIALAYLEHKKTTEPMCYHFTGVWAGGTSILYPGVEAVETKCMAKGDPYCEFIVEIPKKR